MTPGIDWWRFLRGGASIVANAYDGLHRRASKLVSGTTRHFYYSAGWQVLEERLGGSASADRQFVWGLRYIDDLILRDRGAERFYALQDPNWNVTAICDAAGAVHERYNFAAYGQPTFRNAAFALLASSAYDWETLFGGYRWDSDSRSYLSRSRFLDSALGVWITRDPLTLIPTDANLYLYCNAKPTNLLDPSGTQVLIGPHLQYRPLRPWP